MSGYAGNSIVATGSATLATASELDQFYRQYFLPLVRRAMRRHGLSAEDAGDVVQEAFILAISKLDCSKNPKAWLYQVVDHISLNLQRKLRRRADLTAKWHPEAKLSHLNESEHDE